MQYVRNMCVLRSSLIIHRFQNSIRNGDDMHYRGTQFCIQTCSPLIPIIADPLITDPFFI